MDEQTAIFHALEHYTAMKRHDLVIHATKQMDFKITTPIERTQNKVDTLGFHVLKNINYKSH